MDKAKPKDDGRMGNKPMRPRGRAMAGMPPKGWGPEASWLLPAESMPAPTEFVKGVDNPYWPLTPGARWEYRARTPDGTESIAVEVLKETRMVDGVESTVVRDTVSADGQLVEDTFDWYAQDKTGDVWYMGEEVDNYEDGKLLDHKGSWEAGKNGARAGIKMWARPHIGGSPYYQEHWRGQAEDLAKDLGDGGRASVPAGDFSELLVVEEWTPLEPEVVERKYYRKGIGTVREEAVRGGEEVVELIRYSRP